MPETDRPEILEGIFNEHCIKNVDKIKNEVASRPTAGRLGDVLSDRQE